MAGATAKRQMTDMTARGWTERVTYRPLGGEAREIAAMVDREAVEPIMNARTMTTRVTVLNDATDGIAAASLDVGADAIDVAERVGGDVQTRQIQRVTNQDAEYLTLDIR